MNLELLEQDYCFLSLTTKGGINGRSSPLDEILQKQCPVTMNGEPTSTMLGKRYSIKPILEILDRKALYAELLNQEDDFASEVIGWRTRWESMKSQTPQYTYTQAKEVANYEFPDRSKTNEFLESQEILKTPWNPIEVSLRRAVILVNLGLLVTLSYFYLFWEQAWTLNAGAIPGTLFSAIAHTTMGSSIFWCLLSLPAVASILLATQAVKVHLGLINIASPDTRLLFLCLDIGGAVGVLGLVLGIANPHRLAQLIRFLGNRVRPT
jgi:hypothetical protein